MLPALGHRHGLRPSFVQCNRGSTSASAFQVRLRSSSSTPISITSFTIAWHVATMGGLACSAASASCTCTHEGTVSDVCSVVWQHSRYKAHPEEFLHYMSSSRQYLDLTWRWAAWVLHLGLC